VADLTYIRLELEFVYLAVILDAFSRRAIGWALDRTLEAALALSALRMALGRRQFKSGLVHHSDRDVQYACGDYTDLLKQHGIRISMSRRAVRQRQPPGVGDPSARLPAVCHLGVKQELLLLFLAQPGFDARVILGNERACHCQTEERECWQ